MHGIIARAAITYDSEDRLKLTFRAPRYELLRWIPGRFEVDGSLVDGSLVLIDSEHGTQQISHVSRDTVTQIYDYVQLDISRVGCEIDEPMSPIDVCARVEPGIISFDQVDPDAWEPRAYRGDRRVQLAAKWLQNGVTLEWMFTRMAPRDREDLQAIMAGAMKVHQAQTAYVRYLARAMT